MPLSVTVPREKYIRKIRPYINVPLIKVLTGIRRSGKSVLLTQIETELRALGIPKDHIIRINFEDSRYFHLTNASELSAYLTNSMSSAGKYYVLLDEIQEVEHWEKAVNSLFVSETADIYITGSNSRLLSSELSTYLAGRFVEIPIQTLTFSESLDFAEALTGTRPTDVHSAFRTYLRRGGFPILHMAAYSDDSAMLIVNGIYSSVVLRDVIQRHSIRNIDIFERLVRFLLDNVGNIFSAKSISDFLKSENRQITPNTIYEYLNMLEEAFVVRRVSRYDISGKRILKTLEKYYVSDIAFIHSVLGYKDTKMSGVLENIVYLELLSRDFMVTIGKQGEREIDFIAEKQGRKVYVQVARTILADETRMREFTPLLAVRDQYPKYVVTEDEVFGDNVDGVLHVNIADFLLMEEY